MDVAEAYRQTAAIQGELGRFAPAKENLLKAVALVEALPAEHRDQVGAQVCLSDCFTRLGGLHTNDPQEAVQWQQKALAIRSRLSVTDNNSNANVIAAGSGLDWFWETYGLDTTNRKGTDLLN